MEIEDRIMTAIFNSIDHINEEKSREDRITKSIDANLYGKDGSLDSITLVDLIVAIEEQIEDEFGVAIALADEKALSQNRSPFKSIRRLSNYILALLSDNSRKDV